MLTIMTPNTDTFYALSFIKNDKNKLVNQNSSPDWVIGILRVFFVEACG